MKPWTHAELPRSQARAGNGKPSWDLGSIVQITPTRQHLYLDTHGNPSAGSLLVLTNDLRPVDAFDGWLLATLPNERILYQRSMTHFAPACPAELGLHPALQDRTALLAQAMKLAG